MRQSLYLLFLFVEYHIKRAVSGKPEAECERGLAGGLIMEGGGGDDLCIPARPSGKCTAMKAKPEGILKN